MVIILVDKHHVVACPVDMLHQIQSSETATHNDYFLFMLHILCYFFEK